MIRNLINLKVINSFFGITFVIPEGWFYWHFDDYNLKEDPSLTENESMLNIQQDEDTGEIYLDFFDIGNNNDEYSNEHLSVAARAIKLENGFDRYIEDYINLNTSSENVSLVYEGTEEINGAEFKRIVFYSQNPHDEYDSTIMDTFTIERNGYAITIKFNSWAAYPDNEQELMVYMHYFVSVT